VNKEGKTIFQHASGKRGVGTDEPMTMDNIFWIASCTKMIGGIACMQLVEQRKLSLDDADLAEKLCPELKDVQIVTGIGEDGKPIMKAKKNRITLRMLLSHTGVQELPSLRHEVSLTILQLVLAIHSSATIFAGTACQ
jgi:CubicO group peptidase (beta-lactamase class C family)